MEAAQAVIRRQRPPAIDDAPIVIGGYALAIADALESQGADRNEIFRLAGIPQGLTNDPLDRLTGQQIGSLMRASVAATSNPYFGLSVADALQASHFHALGYALLASRTLLDFSQRLSRHLGLVSQSADLRVEQGRDDVTLCLSHRVYTRSSHEDFFWAFVLRFMRLLYRPSLAPLRVGFHRSCPEQGPGPYLACFGVMPSFGQHEMTMSFHRADMTAALTGACPELAQVNDRIAGEYVARLDQSDLRARVRARILERLADGDSSRQQIARDLCMSEANLQLRLRQRGTTFQDLLDEIRRDMALAYLSQRRLSITEITYLTGFGDTSNFTRAFRRWTGMSPSAWRSLQPD